jgi:2-dehydro-3-deoxygluconokinase
VIGELRRRGVDTSTVAARPGRLGLYFLTPGAGLRASEVVYDRAHSVFADAPGRQLGLGHGARRRHPAASVGHHPGTGEQHRHRCDRRGRCGAARGIPVSFDGNYRAKLWEAWDSDPRRSVLTG